MRRTFQGLAQAAEMNDIVTRAVSGHATETMQRHYSTVRAEGVREGIGKVLEMAGLRRRAEKNQEEDRDREPGGVKTSKEKMAG
jgi:hypothetical protein